MPHEVLFISCWAILELSLLQELSRLSFFKSRLIALICQAIGIFLYGEHFFDVIYCLSYIIFIKIQKLWVEAWLASVIS